MKILGIITEYNPFHKGHEYQIKKAREISGADFVVVVMSGHFVQRGEPAVYDPYFRCASALKNGVDAVFMMPLWGSTSSAEGFAFCGVSILEGLGCDIISYGIEEEDEGPIPGPNNILAKEYRKAMKRLGSKMEVLEIPRIGSGYKEESLDCEYPSATALRKAVLSGRMKDPGYALGPDDMMPVLRGTLMRLIRDGRDLTEFSDVCPELADRIRKLAFKEGSFEERVLDIKTKRYAYTRIARCLVHILLDIKKGDECPVYADLIGFRKDGEALLTELKKRSVINFISKKADHKDLLSADAYGAEVYNMVFLGKYNRKLPNFFVQKMIIVL